MNSTFKKIEFIKSSTKKEEFLYDKKVITFLGRSNVGKSTLINSLINEKNFMKVSKTPGRTIYVNYALVNDKFYIADVPGYGFASDGGKTFPKLMKDFLEDNSALKKIYLLIDSRRGFSIDEEDFLDYLLDLKIPIVIIFTKYDKLNTSEKAFLKKQEEKVLDVNIPFFEAAYNDNKLLEKIRKNIVNTIY